jgi:hypothetical protein
MELSIARYAKTLRCLESWRHIELNSGAKSQDGDAMRLLKLKR